MNRIIFKSEFKRQVIPNITILVIAILCYIFSIYIPYFNSQYFSGYSANEVISSSWIINYFFLAGLTIVNFSYNKRKINNDLYYSLPVTKIKLYLNKFLISIIHLTLYFVLNMILTLPVFGSTNYGFVDPAEVIIGQTLLFIFSIIVFSFFVVCYYHANSVFDGILYLIFASNLLSMLVAPILYFTDTQNYAVKTTFSQFTYSSNLMFLPTNFIRFESDGGYLPAHANFFPLDTLVNLLGIIFLSLLVFVFPLSLIYVKKDKAERSQQVSTSIIDFKLVLPLFTMFMTVFLAYLFNKPFAILALIISFFLYVAFRKSFKLKLVDFIGLGVSIIYFILVVSVN